MTRKTFIALAAVIRTSIHDKAQRDELARALIPALRETNPLFKPDRWLDAAVGD